MIGMRSSSGAPGHTSQFRPWGRRPSSSGAMIHSVPHSSRRSGAASKTVAVPKSASL